MLQSGVGGDWHVAVNLATNHALPLLHDLAIDAHPHWTLPAQRCSVPVAGVKQVQ